MRLIDSSLLYRPFGSRENVGISNIDRRVDISMSLEAAADTVEAGIMAIALVDVSTLAALLTGVTRIYNTKVVTSGWCASCLVTR
jgi:hypothetical protein